jgi:hypothetical protein
MKKLLPYLGALVLGASIVIAINGNATGQTPQATSSGAEISQLYLIHGLFPSPTGGGLVIDSKLGYSMELRANEFIVRHKDNPEVRHIPMSAVGWYKVANEQ